MGLDISPLEVNTKVPSGWMVNPENHWPAQCPVSAVSGEEEIFFFFLSRVVSFIPWLLSTRQPVQISASGWVLFKDKAVLS